MRFFLLGGKVCNSFIKQYFNCSSVATMSTTLSRQHSVYVTRNVPESGIQLLTSAGLKVTQNISQVDALFCLLTDKVDSELLDAAGIYS